MQVTKEMSVVKILSAYPLAREVFKRHGIEFIGKKLSPLEPLDVVARGNNCSDQTIQDMVTEINTGIKKAQDELFSGDLLHVTPEAAAYLVDLLKQRDREAFHLRLASDGCGLYSYDLDFATMQHQDEVAFTTQGLTFYIEKKTLGLLKGTHIEFQDGGLFFNNPNVRQPEHTSHS